MEVKWTWPRLEILQERENRNDLLAILQKRLDQALFLYIFIHEIRSSGVRASISVVQIQKFDTM